jgi:hypothetical protein
MRCHVVNAAQPEKAEKAVDASTYGHQAYREAGVLVLTVGLYEN